MAKVDYTVTQTNGYAHATRIIEALGTRPEVTVSKRRHYLTDSVDKTRDKITGVTFQKNVLIVTLKKGGQFRIDEGYHFTLDKKKRTLYLEGEWITIQV